MLANGTDAAVRTTPTRTARTSQPGRPMTVATIGGAPASVSQPPIRARVPAAIAGGTSGTTTRFTAGARRAKRPKPASTTGSVAASAANDTPRLSASQPGRRPACHARSRSVIDVAQAMRPAVARTDSWKPASPTVAGSASRRRVTAQPSAVVAAPARPDSRAASTTAAMTAARTTDGDAPAATV